MPILLASGRVRDATNDAALAKLLTEPLGALQASVAWGLAGDSREWRHGEKKSAAACQRGDTAMNRAAAMLRAAHPPAIGEWDDLIVPPQIKSLLAAAMMQCFPEQSPYWRRWPGS